MIALWVRLLKDETGATVIEYGLIASIISLALIGDLNSVSPELNATFADANSGLASR